MSSVRIHLDHAALVQFFTDVEARQFPFAMSRTLNVVTGRAQKASQDHIEQAFTIAPSKRAFLLRMVKWAKEDRSTKYQLMTTLKIDGPRTGTGKDKKRDVLLSRHEEGGTRSFDGTDYPGFIPTDDLRGGSYDLVPRSMYPGNLRLAPRRDISGGTMEPRYRTTKRGTIQLVGKRGTFIIDDRADNPKGWGIFQRFGKARDAIRMIWAFRKSITLPPRLEFYATVQGTVDREFAETFARELADAVRTAR